MCATEQRRRRKRGLLPQAERKVVINDLVCEGCGDCSVKSNCLAVVPLESEWGRKRAVDQSSCNQDASCIRGFCPSFVTVSGAALRKPQSADLATFDAIALPEPKPAVPREPVDILVTGIGGTGVVTIGAILAMAAHIEGRAATTLDQTGLAQKGGQVMTHLRIAGEAAAIAAVKLSPASADLVIGADLVGAASKDALLTMRGGTRVLLNREAVMTGAFTRAPDLRLDTLRLRKAVASVAGEANVATLDATALARRLLGDAIGANMLLVGWAWQQGLIPIGEAAIRAAIRLNDTAVAMNEAAFRIGRIAAVNPDALEPRDDAREARFRLSETLDEAVARRTAFLTDYQDAAYADRYVRFVDAVRAAERRATGREGPLADAAARGLFRLMAYKDEYEVARLHADAGFARQLADTFEGTPRLEYHLAPPLFARRDPVTGEPRKRRFGPWMGRVFRLLRHGKRLRGTPFDPFGYTAERRTERALIGEYRARVEAELAALSPATLARSVKVAEAAQRIRGYGHVKARNLAEVRAEWERLAVEAPAAEQVAA